MQHIVTSDVEGVEIAEALGLPIKHLVGFELKVKAGHTITIVADYDMGEEAFSKFFTLCDKFVVKEDTDVNDPE